MRVKGRILTNFFDPTGLNQTVTRIGLVVIWLLHFLPLGVLALLGQGLGTLLYAVAGERRRVVLLNLKLCFPELSEAERHTLARQHFGALTRGFIEHGILWWSSKARLLRLLKVEGIEHWLRIADRPVILLAPHFIGLDMGGIACLLASERRINSFYSRQKNAVFDQILIIGRTRFGQTTLFARQDGIRPMIKSLKSGEPFYYLPDMDLGDRDSVFVPFFGVPTATITALSRIAQVAGAVVVPCVTQQLPGGAGYVARLYPAWEDFPTTDPIADARRMNAFIEARVREMPAQYYWVHKRFKTRPAGEKNPYET